MANAIDRTIVSLESKASMPRARLPNKSSAPPPKPAPMPWVLLFCATTTPMMSSAKMTTMISNAVITLILLTQ